MSSRPQRNPSRKVRGVKSCGKQCLACPYIKEGKLVKGPNFTWKIRDRVTCESKNVVYMIECTKCNQRYINQTKRQLKGRLANHLGYVKNKMLREPTGSHFHLPEHSLHNISMTVLEKLKKPDLYFRRVRESYLIEKFNTFRKGINKQPEQVHLLLS